MTWLRRVRSFTLAVAASFGITAGVFAANNYLTVTGENVPMSIVSWLNGSSQAVPTSAANPVPVNIVQSGGIAANPCTANAPTFTAINISASGAVKIVTGASNKKTYACGLLLSNNAADNISIIEGTGSNCAAGQTAVFGGTAASAGLQFPANGGLSLPFTGYAHFVTGTAADDLCLNPSASTQLTGYVMTVQQ